MLWVTLQFVVISTKHINNIIESLLEATIDGQHYGCCYEMSNEIISIKLMALEKCRDKKIYSVSIKNAPKIFFPKSHSIVNNNRVATFSLQ